MGKRLLSGLIGVGFLTITGCSSDLETGYKPRLLGASDTQRRAYYASPFTREAKAAQQEQQTELEARRPRPGY